MKVEIRDTAIRNIANGLKMIEQSLERWEEMALEAKRGNADGFIVRGYEKKAEMYRQQLFTAEQVLCELGSEFYDMVKAEMGE